MAGVRDGDIERYAAEWRELRNTLMEIKGAPLMEIKGAPHAGASFLAFYRDRMMAVHRRLLELGFDMSNPGEAQVVPVPATRHPKTAAQVRRWNAELLFRVQEFLLSFSVTGVGAHVVYSAVGAGPLADVLAGYLSDRDALSREELTALVSRSNLEYLALACALWLLEPVGAQKACAAEFDAACFERMLYAFEGNALIRINRQARNDELSGAARQMASNAMAGWALSELSWSGEFGSRLRRALDNRYGSLLQELPAASLIAWEDREPQEPLRPAGAREKNLVSRTDENLRGLGNEAVIKDKLAEVELTEHARPPEEDPGYEEVERRLTAEQELNQLEVWVEKAALSEQEKQVYKLDRQYDEDTRRIARELGKSDGHVRVVRKNYRDKINEARKAAGLYSGLQ